MSVRVVLSDVMLCLIVFTPLRLAPAWRLSHDVLVNLDRRPRRQRRLLSTRSDRAANLDGGCVRGRQRRGHDACAGRNNLRLTRAGADDTAILGDLDITNNPHPHRQQRSIITDTNGPTNWTG